MARDVDVRVVALEREVRDRARVEAELRDNLGRTQYALAAARMGIWEIDLQRDRVIWSEGTAEVYGWPPDKAPRTQAELLGIVHEDDRALTEAKFERAVRDRVEFVCEYRARQVDGRYHWIDSRAVISHDECGRPVRALGVAIDAEMRKLLEEQVRQSEKLEAVGQLAGGLAHDFNNLLTAILGFTNLLLATFDADDARRTDAEEIVRAADRAGALTRQLLTLGRRQVVQVETLDMNRLVSDTVRMLRRLVPDDVDIAVVLQPGLAPVRADGKQIEQILTNLAINARDAMPAGGRLTIETADAVLDADYAAQHLDVRPGPYVRLTVSDTGTGMTDEVRARLFEPFFTTKGLGKGTGLGLATIHSIARQSGGHVWVYSELHRGTTFKVYLPRAEERPAAEVLDRPAAPQVGSELVLVVEDERAVRYLVRTILGRAGYEVHEAGSADEAEAWLAGAARCPDLLISDVIMPGGSGPDLYRRIQARHPIPKVLYMSGYTDDTVERDRLIEPGVAFIQKPFTSEDLARKVRDVLDDRLADAP